MAINRALGLRQVQPNSVSPVITPEFLASVLGGSVQTNGNTVGNYVQSGAASSDLQNYIEGLQYPEIPKEYANTTVQNQTQQPGNFLNFLTSDPSVLASQDLGSNLYSIGRSLGFNTNGPTVSNTSAARTGRTLSLIGHSGSALLQGLQNVLGGISTQKRYNEFWDNYYQNLYETEQRSIQYLKNGGQIKKMAQGGNVTTVEVEDGEYIRDPQGNIIEVEGRTHEQGGEDMLLQIGSEVTSDNKKIGVTGVNKFKEAFSGLKLNLKPSNTYAEVAKKVDSKLGIEKVREEMDRVSSQLSKLDTNDSNTYQLNSSYLRNKIAQLQEQLKTLQNSRLKAIDYIFDAQEESKGTSSTSSSSLNQMFENGGTITDNQLEIIKRKTGLSSEYIKGYIRKAQKSNIKKMADGGTVYFQQILNSFAAPQYNSQRFTDTGANAQTSGNVNTDYFTQRVQETMRIFPQSQQYFNIERDENGNISDIKFKTKNSVKEYQDYVNRVYNNISKYADKYIPDESQRQQLKDYVKGLEFDTKDTSSVKFTDNIFGNFTSSRSGVGLPLVTKDELDKLTEKGITNFSQLFDANGNLNVDYLSENTANTLRQIRTDYGNDFEAVLTSLNQSNELDDQQIPNNPVQQQGLQQKDIQQQLEVFDPTSDLNGLGSNTQPTPFSLPYIPNQYRYDWDTPIEQLAQTVNYGRITPRRIEPTAALQEIENSLGIGLNSLRGYADPQRLALTSQLVAESQGAINQVISEAEAWNSLNSQQVDIYNNRVAQAEADAQRQENRLYEQLSLSGLALTDQNNETIANNNRRTRLNNYNVANRLRTINNIAPNYRVDSFGNVVFDPQSTQQFSAPDNTGLDIDQLIALLAYQQDNGTVSTGRNLNR